MTWVDLRTFCSSPSSCNLLWVSRVSEAKTCRPASSCRLPIVEDQQMEKRGADELTIGLVKVTEPHAAMPEHDSDAHSSSENEAPTTADEALFDQSQRA